ncbi:hypothetical protein [Schinkia azotoformans]|uniref:hypothetical protein n=1 Tax=Schinkia azotoformans TaxID=1454 RepID=UPI002DB76D00|nr:hypothetical protein [Schinkia azotoformans]MEC1778064.1 hypothetical protein [Schinkia azotoformans]MED4328124.1 hypothetical protein [Schinkia azotoformans]
MEFALAIQSTDQITCLDQPWNISDHSLIEQETLGNVQNILQSFYESPTFTRLYVGSEFCQYRLPKVHDLVRTYHKAVKSGFLFTFVTPYITQAGMVQLKQLLAVLHEEALKNNDTIEIVVNDWGVLYEVNQNYSQFQPVVGRLLNKMIRDPRVAHLYDREDAPQKANAVLQTSAVSVSYFKRFLQTNQVKRIEFDNLIQNMGSPLGEEDFSSSLHIGFGVIASGRSCLVGTLHRPKEEKFKGEVKCKQQCRHYQVELVSKKERLGALPTRNIQKGNSVFYQQTEELLVKGIQWALEKNVNRLVVSPKIPV